MGNRAARRQHSAFGQHAHFLLPGKTLFTNFVPALGVDFRVAGSCPLVSIAQGNAEPDNQCKAAKARSISACLSGSPEHDR